MVSKKVLKQAAALYAALESGKWDSAELFMELHKSNVSDETKEAIELALEIFDKGTAARDVDE